MTTINSNTTYTWQPVNGSIGGMAAQITALLTAGGWIQTADTGQTSNATFATIYNGTLNSSSGYQIWRMNDSLQGTYPVFIKIEFGCGSVSNTPAMWVTIGTGSNGTGTITGIVIARTQFNAGLTASTVLIVMIQIRKSI